MRFFRSLLVLFFLFQVSAPGPAAQTVDALDPEDEALLELVQEKSFGFFLNEVNRKNGLVADRAHNHKKGAALSAASIASVGFALTAYPVGVERGWMDYATAYELTRRTLEFFLKQVEHEHGFFYHFLNMNTGERARRSELSPIDTALFLAGALFAAEYFEDPLIEEMANELYERVDFEWMLNGGETLALAWSPEKGFSKYRWDSYNESMILYLLAIASPTHPIPAESWKAIRRPVGSYGNYRLIQIAPLFTHQYSHIWVDFRDKNDGFADYFQNSVNAAKANRAFCIDQSSEFRTYGPNAWGLTASDGPFGYRAFGAPPGWALHDGTLAPTGCAASIVFTPAESIACMRHLYEEYGDRLWGMYGFSDAFNLERNWFDQEVIGIDQGAMFLMIENFRSGMIWEVMGRSEWLQTAMDAVGFRPGTKELPWPEAPVYQVPYAAGGMQIDGYLRDWSHPQAIRFEPSMRESGQIKDARDFSGDVRFAWNEEALFFSAKVADDDIVARRSGQNVWRDDVLEFFIDPDGDGLFWKNEKDFQLGFRPDEKTSGAVAWSWFQGGENPIEERGAKVRSFMDEEGFILEGAIDWRYLGVTPKSGMTLRLSPALHDVDRDRSEAKLQWHFRSEEAFLRFTLGRLELTGGEEAAALP